MNTQQQALLDVAKTSLGSLPERGQIEVFNHLDSTIRAKIVSGALANMSAEDRREILSAYPAVPALDQPLSASTTEQKLRAENRIQDDPAILAKLGYDNALPKISSELLEECARTSGTVVLKFKTTVLDYQAKLNESLGKQKGRLGLSYIDDNTLATTNEEPTWINVPNTVKDDTLKLSKATALRHVRGSQTCDPMDTVLMLGYNNLQAGQQMPGFTNKWTFTSQKNTVVGSDGGGIYVLVRGHFDVDGNGSVGLAPRFAPEPKKV